MRLRRSGIFQTSARDENTSDLLSHTTSRYDLRASRLAELRSLDGESDFELTSPEDLETIATGTTAEGGWNGFTDLPTDECYTVAVTIPDGYQTSPLGDPTKPGASTANPDGTTGPICLTANTPNQDQWDTGLMTFATGSMLMVDGGLSV